MHSTLWNALMSDVLLTDQHARVHHCTCKLQRHVREEAWCWAWVRPAVVVALLMLGCQVHVRIREGRDCSTDE